jgi:hypothetical protein
MLPPCACLVRIMPPTVLPRRYARRPRRTLHSQDYQRKSRKLSVDAAALCSPCANLCPSLYCPGRGVRYVRPIGNAHQGSSAFTSGERKPRRTLRSHECQRASRKPSAHAVALCSLCAHHVPHCTAQAQRAEAAAYATLARLSSKVFKTKPGAKGGRCVRYARSHDSQRASRKQSMHAVALCSPCAHHVPHCTAQAVRAETAAYSTLARLSTRQTRTPGALKVIS